MALDLGSIFGSKAQPLLGLDISSTAVKIVELTEGSKGALRLERYATELLPRGAVVDGSIENIEAVSDAIQRAWKKAGSKTKNVAMALPTAAVITKKIQLTAGLSEQELEVQVESEANQYIPFALEEVSLDWTRLGPAPNTPDEEEILIAASRKEKVEDRVAVAQRCGLKPVIMDIESMAGRASIERAIAQLPDGGTNMVIALFTIGAFTTGITVSLNGQSVYEREQAFGGNQLTQDIARAYGLAPEEAEVKKRSGDLPEGWERDMMQPFVENVALEITRALQFFFTSTPYNRVDQILLAGGCAVMPGLVDVVGNRTQVPSQVVSPFKGMDISSNVSDKKLRLDAPGLVVAAGLAMRRFSQ